MSRKPETGSRSAKVGYWVATGLAAVAFAVPGVANLVHAPHIAEDMARLGYPPYFMTILGGWKILAAVAVLVPRFPRLKEWAYAGMIFDLSGAALSRAAVGDGALLVTIPLCIAGLVLVSWALRPPNRAFRPSLSHTI